MRCWVLFFCCLFYLGVAKGQSCYNIFTTERPKIKLKLKSGQLNRLLNRRRIKLEDPEWLHIIHKIGNFEPGHHGNFSIETQKLHLQGSAEFVGNSLNLKISFVSTTLVDRLKDGSYMQAVKKVNFLNLNPSKVMRFNEINMNLKAPLKEVLAFIQSLSEHIKQHHPNVNKIELTADQIHNERLYNSLKKLHFKTDVPALKRIVQAYYVVANLSLYSFLMTGSPDLGWFGAGFVSVSNAALFWIPLHKKFKRFKHEGERLKLTIPIEESDNSRR